MSAIKELHQNRKGLTAGADGASEKLARWLAITMLTVSLLSACVADPTPECAQAEKDFEEALPSATGLHLASGDVVPAIVAGVTLAVVDELPDDDQRQRCYDEIMNTRFSHYPPYATVR